MIKITRDRRPAALHPDFTGDRLAKKLIELARARQKSREAMKFTGQIGDWKKAKDALKVEAHGKCAFCEADTETVAHGDVEHFRPKSTYWWLALCVDNYTYSCQICNQSYKGDKFPISGAALIGPKLPEPLPTTAAALKQLAAKMAPDPATVTDADLRRTWFKEDAHLPNPYLDDPETLFAWKVADVSREVVLVPLSPKPKVSRAVKAAEDYLGLNRETLKRSRYLVYKSLDLALQVWEADHPTLAQPAEAEIRKLCDSTCMFAGMSRYFARQRGFPL